MGDLTNYRRPAVSRRRAPTGIEKCSIYDPPTSKPTGMDFVHYDPMGRVDTLRHIHAKKPHLYRIALNAQLAYLKVKNFEPTYQRIILASYDLNMRLDDNDQIVFEFTKAKTLRNLIKDAVLDKVLDEVEGNLSTALKKRFMSKKGLARYTKFSIVVDHLMMVYGIYKNIDNVDLVTHQTGRRAKEAKEKKLRFCTTVIAVARLRSANNPRVSKVSRYIYNQFQEFDTKWQAWSAWQIEEERLAGRFKARPGRPLIGPR